MLRRSLNSAAVVVPPWPLAWRLAIGQIFSWGILYYTFTVVVGPMQSGTGWSRTFLNGGLSLGLLAWGLCAYPVGLWIQRRGARGLMAAASAGGGIAIMLMAVATEPAAYLIAWIMLGAAMAGLLYDPAFAVVTATFGQHYRRGITLITLVGGLASTVFIPLAQVAVTHFGWRSALLMLGALQVFVCVPLHAWGVPSTPRGQPLRAIGTGSRINAWWATLRADVSDPRFIAVAIWFTAHSAAFTGLIFQLIPLLQSWQVSNSTIVTALTVMGPMQVAGRMFLSTKGRAFATLRVGAFAMATLLVGLLILFFLPLTLAWLALFAAALGLGNGMLTIVRGTAVAELFGIERYAEINGALAAPAVLAKAAAPLLLATLWSTSPWPGAVPLAALCTVLVGCAALAFLIRHQQARSRRGAGSARATEAVPARVA